MKKFNEFIKENFEEEEFTSDYSKAEQLVDTFLYALNDGKLTNDDIKIYEKEVFRDKIEKIFYEEIGFKK